MLHTIISESDIFFSDRENDPQLCQKRYKNGVATMIREGDGLKPYSFFSTDPKDYINKNLNPLMNENQVFKGITKINL